MSRFPDTRSPSGQRPEPKPANVAPAANAAGSLTSAAPSRSCPRYEPTWRRPSQLPSGESNSRLSLAPESSRPDAPVTWTPVDSSAPRALLVPTMWSGGQGPSPWTHGPPRGVERPRRMVRLVRESARCSAWPRHTSTLRNDVSGRATGRPTGSGGSPPPAGRRRRCRCW
jgi:hypothetical protein